MPRIEFLLLSSMLILGILDWLTTMTGIVYFCATELNPFLAALTQTNLVLFSLVKLAAISLAGLAFYKAICLANKKGSDWNFTKRFLNGGLSITSFLLMPVVASNIIALLV
jgi:hypothetical protein